MSVRKLVTLHENAIVNAATTQQKGKFAPDRVIRHKLVPVPPGAAITTRCINENFMVDLDTSDDEQICDAIDRSEATLIELYMRDPSAFAFSTEERDSLDVLDPYTIYADDWDVRPTLWLFAKRDWQKRFPTEVDEQR